jgi:hypothetical protein
MTNTPKTDALIAGLTIEQAREYEAQIDKLIWIEYTLLDPNNISRNMAERVEDALIEMLQAA